MLLARWWFDEAGGEDIIADIRDDSAIKSRLGNHYGPAEKEEVGRTGIKPSHDARSESVGAGECGRSQRCGVFGCVNARTSEETGNVIKHGRLTKLYWEATTAGVLLGVG